MKLLIKPENDSVKELYHDSALIESNEQRISRGDAGLDLYCPEVLIIEPHSIKFIILRIQCGALSDSDNKRFIFNG